MCIVNVCQGSQQVSEAPQQPGSQAYQQQSTTKTKGAKATYIGHRQSSRLANRFQRQDDDDAENGVAEEFDNWRTSRAQHKQRFQP